MIPETDHLILRIAEGDETAFRQLFDMYYTKLLHFAVYFLHTKELAEEAVSDVFVIIWKKREVLIRVKCIQSYLYMAVKNQALHYIRRSPQSPCESIDLYHVELIRDQENPEIALVDREYRKLIQQAINSLPEKCREVFRLVLMDKLKQKEIAQLLDISVKTVEAHIATAYKRIAIYVNKEYKIKKM